jgi:hypothetical protein
MHNRHMHGANTASRGLARTLLRSPRPLFAARKEGKKPNLMTCPGGLRVYSQNTLKRFSSAGASSRIHFFTRLTALVNDFVFSLTVPFFFLTKIVTKPILSIDYK